MANATKNRRIETYNIQSGVLQYQIAANNQARFTHNGEHKEE